MARVNAAICALVCTLSFVLCACSASQASSAGVTTSTGAPTPTATTIPLATPTPSSTATAVPTATPLPPLAANLFVAGVDVGGLMPEAARAKIERELAPLLRPIDVRVEQQQTTLTADDIKLRLDLDAMLTAATGAEAGDKVPLALSFDKSLLEVRLHELAGKVAVTPDVTVITATKSISRSFALAGGQMLDIPAAVEQIGEQLQSVGAPRRITLSLVPATTANVRPTPEQLQEQIEAMAKQWKGIVGVYVYDLASDQEIASLNKNTVFSGASVMKVPILLNSYINLDTFTTRHETWLRKMIVESDNYSANTMLAVSVGGAPTDTDKALEGALKMSAMLKDDLGLQHTYQNMPYEASDYLVKVRGIKIKRGPAQEGPPPYTDADPVLRTTPAEMSQVFLLIEQCSQGQGELLDKFERLTPERCAEMIKRLQQNGDHTRLVAGLPRGAVAAHKSGWIEDMQSDVGIVESPGGNYLVAIYVYRDMRGTGTYLTDQVATPVIAAFSRLIYSYYNPVPAHP